MPASTPDATTAPRLHRTTLLFGGVWTALLVGGYLLFAWQTGRFPGGRALIPRASGGGQYIEVWGEDAKFHPETGAAIADLSLPTFLLFERASSDPVYAVTGGVVKFAGRIDGFGQVVIIDAKSNADRELIYAHLDELAVATGDELDAGARLGLAGAGGPLGEYVVRFEVVEGANVIAPGAALEMAGASGGDLPSLLFGGR